jgi:PHD/YefM family antitoxin component YafN of YafNO toxin-antitoxin module
MPDNNEANNETTTSNSDTVPYTITEQDGKLNVVFISGPMQGQSFQIDRPQHFDAGQSQQVEEEPPYPYSYLDGDGNEISEEEFERMSAIETAEEARLESESRAAQAARKFR